MAAGLNAILAPSVNASGYRNFKIKSIARNACFIVINTDLISDFSPMLIQLRKQAPDAGVIVIDSMKSDFADNADVFIRVSPGTEPEALKEIMQKKSSKLRFIDKNKWSDCQNLTAGRKVYLIYNPANMIGFKPIAALTLIPIFTAPNAAYLSKFELSNIRDLLDDSSIDCLYIIGRTPHLDRDYKSIISQDCFIPDARVNVFLPASAFTEIKGSIIGYDGKVKRLKQLVPSKGESQSDVAIIDAVIKKMMIKPTAVKKQKLRKAKVPGSRQKIRGNNNRNLIVRESGYAYRNTRFS